MFEELFSLIGQFEKHGRLQEAHDLYVCLIDHFPNVSELKKCALQLAISQLRTAKHLYMYCLEGQRKVAENFKS